MLSDTFAAPMQQQLTPRKPPANTLKTDDEQASVSGSDGESSADEARADPQSRKRKRSMKISYATLEHFLRLGFD